jgi:ribosomal protein L7/L12
MRHQIEALMNVLQCEDDETVQVYIAKALRRKVMLFTDSILPSRGGEPGPHQWDKITTAELEAANAGKKIQAIKLIRNRTGMGLLQAKQLIEWLGYPGENHPVPDHVRKRQRV